MMVKEKEKVRMKRKEEERRKKNEPVEPEGYSLPRPRRNIVAA